MTLNITAWRIAALFGIVVIVAGCALREGRSSVWEKERPSSAKKIAVTSNEKDWRPDVHVVQKGETLYGIAFNYGLDYHEVAEINSIQSPWLIHIGQELRLFSGDTSSTSSAQIKSNVGSESLITQPVENAVREISIKEQPIALKLDYSNQAVVQIEKIQAEQLRPSAGGGAQPPLLAVPGTVSSGKRTQFVEVENRDLVWGMPAQGNTQATHTGGSNRKGIDITGKLGQPVVASAAGKVVYNGSGLRGYGNLVIIKHNKTFISAYAHNDKIVVREGQLVSKGQKIAEMGNTDTNQVKLYFEIRKFGKPVDPADYLPI